MFLKIVLVVKFFLRVRDEFDIDGLFENLEFIVKLVKNVLNKCCKEFFFFILLVFLFIMIFLMYFRI